MFLLKIMGVPDLILAWFLLLFSITKVRDKIRFCFQQFKKIKISVTVKMQVGLVRFDENKGYN